MIIDLPNTTTNAINKRLVSLRDEGGAIALGRVLTLVINTTDAAFEEAIEAANDASREHPCRVIVVTKGVEDATSSLDAEIRVGGDAGASEVVRLRLNGELAPHGEAVITPLLLPDAPIVAWWPQLAPDNPSASHIGSMAQRRITDSAAAGNPCNILDRLRDSYSAGDTDLAWTRLTLWRAFLASALDLPPHEPVRAARVEGNDTTPSADLLAAWLALTLKCPVERTHRHGVVGITKVELERPGGTITIDRQEGDVATLSQPGQPVRHVALPHRNLRDCLSEELRRLDPDDVYGEVLVNGLPQIGAR